MKITVVNTIFVFCCICSLFLISCSKYDKKPKVYSENEAIKIMLELTPEECSDFYRINYQKNTYLDSLFVEAILPCFQDIPLIEFKSSIKKLRNTPVEEYAVTIYEDLYDELIAEIADELDSLTYEQQQAFSEDVMPIIEVVLDSLICSDLTAVIEEYSGGLMNYKKLALFGGRDANDFKDKWNQMVDQAKYNNAISEYVNDYFEILNNYQNEYVQEIIGKKNPNKLNYTLKTVKVKFNEECFKSVSSYNKREKTGMVTEFLKDWLAPAALALVTGGTSTVLYAYEAANLGYDIVVTADDIMNEKPSSEDILMYECANAFEEQITKLCYNPMQESIYNIIEERNSEILNQIASFYSL